MTYRRAPGGGEGVGGGAGGGGGHPGGRLVLLTPVNELRIMSPGPGLNPQPISSLRSLQSDRPQWPSYSNTHPVFINPSQIFNTHRISFFYIEIVFFIAFVSLPIYSVRYNIKRREIGNPGIASLSPISYRMKGQQGMSYDRAVVVCCL